MIEVLKQALGALEDFVDVIKYDNEQDDIGRRACCDVLSYNPHSESCKAIKSIASLRQAIAELESQEPVATVTSETGADITMSWWHEPALPVGTKLFTHPPQRTWVGLTDYEIGVCSTEAAMNRSEMVGGAVTFARAIEAKLKEKNNVAQETNS
jgi:hypothetical protein